VPFQENESQTLIHFLPVFGVSRIQILKNQSVHYQTLIEDYHCALKHGFHCALTQDYHFPTLDYLSETLQVLQGMDFCFQIQILKLLNSLMEMETHYEIPYPT